MFCQKKIKATIKLLNEIDKALEKKYHESLAFDIRERYTKSKYEIISVLDELSKQDKDCLEDVIKDELSKQDKDCLEDVIKDELSKQDKDYLEDEIKNELSTRINVYDDYEKGCITTIIDQLNSDLGFVLNPLMDESEILSWWSDGIKKRQRYY